MRIEVCHDARQGADTESLPAPAISWRAKEETHPEVP